ncbi:MAG: hypothetical protein J6Q89_06930 [Clostridia bacterium]|nr:hypothetical protein [Clostridia bacterium]
MKFNVNKTRRIALIIGLIMMLTVVLAACVNTENVPEILDAERIENNASEVIVDTSNDDVSTEDGHTEQPSVAGVVNIKPTTVAVYGTCEENATVRVKGGVEDAETVAHGGYYIIEVDIWDRDTLLRVTAQAEGEEESAVREVIAKKNATADTLLDGNSVSVGVASRLYFDKMVTDLVGDNLYTASELNAIRSYISDTVTSYYNDRAGAQQVELVYVLLPNATSIYPEILPESITDKAAASTIYDQINDTLSQTRATVVDMKKIFEEAKKDTELMEKYGGLFRETDSCLTDYGAYLTYREIMNVVAKRFPDAAPRTEEEFDWKATEVLGGNLVGYREIDKNVIKEEVIAATPKFSLDIGANAPGKSKISSLRKYFDKENGDYTVFTTADAGDNINGIAERWLIEDTGRTDLDLPSALIYRDYSALVLSDILAERFEKCMLNKAGELALNLTIAGQYAAEGDNVVDYIIVIVSEENLDNAFKLALS